MCVPLTILTTSTDPGELACESNSTVQRTTEFNRRSNGGGCGVGSLVVWPVTYRIVLYCIVLYLLWYVQTTVPVNVLISYVSCCAQYMSRSWTGTDQWRPTAACVDLASAYRAPAARQAPSCSIDVHRVVRSEWGVIRASTEHAAHGSWRAVCRCVDCDT